ncbi:uncharacterized protein PRCAT00001186001 [Priceomyces carsonii]|uniref:uncharacterized protein n=1 Tax=Priceomyces carsonii TaxID=28549 RepID=UPI002EDA9965|nr:unnamed protein product [Priceomyces carsonii]
MGGLSKCKSSTLSQLATLCGIPNQPTKEGRQKAILRYLDLFSRLNVPTSAMAQGNLSVLLMDIGIKNFAYCKVDGIDIKQSDIKSIVTKSQWDKWDLHKEFGCEGLEPLLGNSNGGVLDSKRYLSHLSYLVVNRLAVSSLPRPNVIVVETQRTRSNSNSVTLPNVLLNYTFENMLYSSLYTLSRLGIVDHECLIVPMNANSMANFWINRYVKKLSLAKNSKKYRLSLLLHWLNNPSLSPVRFKDIELPQGFENLSISKKRQVVLGYLGKEKNEKLDDLVDCLLYNITIKFQLSNLYTLADNLRLNMDISPLVEELNLKHYSFIRPLIDELDLELNDDFKYLKPT